MASDRFCRPPVPLTDEDIAYQRKAVAALLPPRPNWKWPISHADRIKELMVAKQEPHHALHRENIEAAIQYHMAFSQQEQLCSSELVWFQGGRQVDAPYQHGDQRPAWSEGVFKQMMNSAGECHLHELRIHIEISVPAVRNGTGQRYTTTMGYDTGSNMLTIFQHELFVLFTLTGIQALRWVPVNVAGGQVLSRQCDVDMLTCEYYPKMRASYC